MLGKYTDCPVKDLKKAPKGLYGRKETWFDRLVQYAFFFVLGAFGMLLYLKCAGYV